ncbi:hypothetical protein BDFB_007455 [Asbolus verrucosus]|uniref:Uncharacterized protein n=1 Tax=Asbolus verrucosus TaxID=1661398 RepID=A0A482VX07_ASBVE|nr:hypothetical protein BDFB_007455 [Asbolus verrucosus]
MEHMVHLVILYQDQIHLIHQINHLYILHQDQNQSPPLPVSRTETNIPKWLEDIKNNNLNITTPQGVFKLGKVGDAVFRPQCPKTPFNVTGECRIVFHCPEIFPILTDITVYLQYFCLLNNKPTLKPPEYPQIGFDATTVGWSMLS